MGSEPLISLGELRRRAVSRLSVAYPPEEAESLVRALFTHFMPEWREEWLKSSGRAPFPNHLLLAWEQALSRLLHHEPLAYITGETIFCALRLKIAPGVFIPRPETEEWACALKTLIEAASLTKILDVGTGSGALAIYFAKAFPQAEVYAIDKNPTAINLARQNAYLNHCQIFVEQVVFGTSPLPDYFPSRWDLIISNPPYVPWDRYSETGLNVRLYEPPDAIFCADLSFYEKLAEMAAKQLSPNGVIAAELFPPRAEVVASLWEIHGLITTLHRDSRGHLRWILGRVQG
ncbi:MAG: HemK/PrmC family methyltransferase [Bacteroidia bacterium]